MSFCYNASHTHLAAMLRKEQLIVHLAKYSVTRNGNRLPRRVVTLITNVNKLHKN